MNGDSPRRSEISKKNMARSTDTVRVAAIGDLHVTEDAVAPYRELFAQISGEADILVEAETTLAAIRQRRAATPSKSLAQRQSPARETLTRTFVATLQTVSMAAEA